MEIVPAISPDELDSTRELFREYEQWLGVDLCFQDFESELACLPGKYAAPAGTILLARESGLVLGCVALRPFGEKDSQSCEMKRLYVRPEGRGQGLGRKLALALIHWARQAGYSAMVLDTLDRLQAAMALYHSLGFRQVEAYYDNPLPGVVYWKLELQASGR